MTITSTGGLTTSGKMTYGTGETNFSGLSYSTGSGPVHQAVLTDPVNQQIITQSVLHNVTVYAPSDASVALYDGNSKIADMVSAGNGNWTYAWTPGSIDYNIALNAVGNVSGAGPTNTVVVAEANAVSQNLTTWHKQSASMTFTSGQADPYGGTSAYLLTMPVTANLKRNFDKTFTLTTANSGFEIWVKPRELFVVTIIPSGTGVSASVSIDLHTFQTAGNKASISVVETRNGWYRLWFKIESDTNPYTSFFIYSGNSLDSTFVTCNAGDGLYYYAPRTADGLLPMTMAQRTTIWYHDTTNGVETWKYGNPFIQVAADSNNALPSGGYNIQVIKPTNWIAGNTYPVLWMMPPLFDSQEASNDHPSDLAVAGNYANIYECIIVIPQIKTGFFQWWGALPDGTANYHDFVAQGLTKIAQQLWGGSTNKEDNLLIGYSKSGVACFALLMRNPTIFGYAAAWDAVFSLDANWNSEASSLGAVTMFSTQVQYELYDPITITPSDGAAISDRTRLQLLGYHTWGPDQLAMKAVLDSNNVPYYYNRSSSYPAHAWNSGWLDGAIAELFALRAAP